MICARRTLDSSLCWLLLSLLSLVVAREGRAETTHEVQWRTIGASHHTAIDVDGKGSPASFVVAEGDGTFGPASVQGLSEPLKVAVERCPEGAAMEFHQVAGTMIRTFRPSLDQVFIRTLSGLACIFEDGRVTSESKAIVIGGTGRFEGATGELVTRTLPQTVGFPEWKGEFNNIVNVTEGRIILRD